MGGTGEREREREREREMRVPEANLRKLINFLVITEQGNTDLIDRIW
jgi:hypothetical protein